jgi:hypothetical protein
VDAESAVKGRVLINTFKKEKDFFFHDGRDTGREDQAAPHDGGGDGDGDGDGVEGEGETKLEGGRGRRRV